MTMTAPCSTSADPTGWSASGCTGHYSCATRAAALTRAAPTPATCKPITCGTGYTAARRISRTWCCYARSITVPITTGNSEFSGSAEAGSGSCAATGGCYPTTLTQGSSSTTRLRSNTNMRTSLPTRLPRAGLVTGSTGNTPSASSPNTENNWRIGPADTIPAGSRRCDEARAPSQDDVRAEHAAHRPSSSTV